MQTLTHEIADGIYRFSTCVADAAPGGFTFNQFLIKADEPLLFHTGPRRLFPLVSEAIARVLQDPAFNATYFPGRATPPRTAAEDVL